MANHLEENVIRYYLMPSLQHISAVNIIIALWSRPQIQKEIVELYKSHEGHREYFNSSLRRTVTYRVSKSVLQLPLPKSTAKILSNIINPIVWEIFTWIRYHDMSIFWSESCWGEMSVAVHYLGLVVWTQRGKIDYKETAKALITKGELTVDYAYNLACTYCFEDDIATTAQKMGDALDFKRLFAERRPMLRFWTSHVKGDFTELRSEVDFYNERRGTNFSVNEYLFKLLTADWHGTNNQVAIKYMWNKLSDEEQSRQIFATVKQGKSPLFVYIDERFRESYETNKRNHNADLMCFFLSLFNEKQQQDVFKAHAGRILLTLLDNWLWEEYFLTTAHHVWNIISKRDFCNVLNELVCNICESHQDVERNNQSRAVFKEFWQCVPKHLREYTFESNDVCSGASVLARLFSEENIDIFQSILIDCNDIQKKKLIFSYSVIKKCSFYVIKNRFDMFEILIKHLSSREDVDCLKQKILDECRGAVEGCFLPKRNYNKLEKFLNWAFESDDQKRKFRQGLLQSKIGWKILQSIIEVNKKSDFMEMEYFLEWCTLGDKERVMKYKVEIPLSYFNEIVFNLIQGYTYQMLEQLLNWCFANDKKQINHFKHDMIQNPEKYGVENSLVRLVVYLVMQDDHLQSLTNFMRWCAPYQKETYKFKTWSILYPTSYTPGVCGELLRENKYELADELVNGCFNSSEMQNFKNELMSSNYFENFLSLDYDDCDKNCKLLKLFKWLNPTRQTMNKFKEQFVNSRWLSDILPILNHVVYNNIM